MSTNLREKLRKQLKYEINSKIRRLEVRMFTNVQAIPEASSIFMTSSGYDIEALSKLELNKRAQRENMDVIYQCNRNIVKLKLIKKLLNTNNVFCIFKCIIDNRYVDLKLYELDELLNPIERECERNLPTQLGQYAMTN